MKRGPKPVPTMARFLSKIRKTLEDHWLWTGANRDGYGIFPDETLRAVLAHRWAYERYVGPIPEGYLVRHDCDIYACVNPGHLRVGTAADNTRDAVERARHVNARKTHCPNGHVYDEGTARHRRCGTCTRAYMQAYRRLRRKPSHWAPGASQLALDL